jgi:hypothetical protein
MEYKKISVGEIDFKSIIEENDCFVDKTLLIRDILELGSQKVVLFTRPRRFGKSLNCDMVKTFLELEVDECGQPLPDEKKENRSLFQDLKIANEPKAMSELGLYPVINLSFGGVKEETWAQCYSQIQDILAKLYKKYRFLLESSILLDSEKNIFQEILNKKATLIDTKLSLKNLSEYLTDFYKTQVVILIDEYDAILTYAYTSEHPYYIDDALPFMQNFLTKALKDNPNLRLGYVTGIFRTAQASIFSLLNNLRVFTVTDNEFSEYFGFTEAEVKEIAESCGAVDKMPEIKTWYNGYKFGKTEIYNTWSIIEYFSRSLKPKPYWINTSDNLLVYELIRDAQLQNNTNIINLMAGKPIQSFIDESIDYNTLRSDDRSLWTFLLSAGYLKPVEDYVESGDEKLYTLIPPNKEIELGLKNLFTKHINALFSIQNLIECIDYLVNGEVVNFQNRINEIISQVVSFRNWYEFFYHGLIIGMVLILADRFTIQPEKESGGGYPDLILTPIGIKDSNGLIMEIKKITEPEESKNLFGDKNQLNKLVYSNFKKDFTQIISQKYQTVLMKENTVNNIFKYTLVFVNKECHALLQVNDASTLKSGDGSSITLEDLAKFK